MLLYIQMNYLNYETSLEQKTEILIVRITPEEKLMYFREAQKLGISISALTRFLLYKQVKESDGKRTDSKKSD